MKMKRCRSDRSIAARVASGSGAISPQRMDTTSRPAAPEAFGRRGAVVWMTGLSGSGKTTTALALAARLERAGKLAYVVDGDSLRAGLCSDLGFSPDNRAENVRRAGE